MTEKLTDDIAKLEAKLRTKKAEKRRQDRRRTRQRKELIGAVALQRIKDGKFTEKELRTMMDEYLERPTERALFGLPPRAKDDQLPAHIAEYDDRAKSRAKKRLEAFRTLPGSAT